MLALEFHLDEPITGFQTLQLIALIVGLAFTAVQVRRALKAARLNNLLALVKSHRELWLYALEHEELQKMVSPTTVVETADELSVRQRQFVNFLLLHISASYEISRSGLATRNRAQMRDTGALLALPAFHVVWQELEQYHSRRFRRYVKRSLKVAARPRSPQRSTALNMDQAPVTEKA